MTSTTASGLFAIQNAGLVKVRVRATAAVTGSALVTAAKGLGGGGNNAGGSGSAGGWTDSGALVSLTTGTDLIGSNLRPTDATYTLGDDTHGWDRGVFHSAGTADIVAIVAADDTPYELSFTNTDAGGFVGMYLDSNAVFEVDATHGIGLNGHVSVGQNAFVAGSTFSVVGDTKFYNAPATSAPGAGTYLNNFQTEYISTSGSATDVTSPMRLQTTIGTNIEATIGAVQNFSTVMAIKGSGSALNEYAMFVGALSAQIGAGFSQTAGPIGNIWGADVSIFSGIGIQPTMFGGWTVTANNYYNGSPTLATSYIYAAATYPNIGAGNDVVHGAATSYPMDDGFLVVGKSGTIASPTTLGFTRAFRCGGSGSNWQVTASLIGTCMDMSQFSVRGLYIHDPTGTPTADIEATGTSIFGNLKMATGGAYGPDTTTAHTALLRAYDVDGTAYKTFATLTNGNTPDFTIAAPAGGSLSVGGLLLTTAVTPASSGTRYLCISTTGAVTSSATACSGT